MSQTAIGLMVFLVCAFFGLMLGGTIGVILFLFGIAVGIMLDQSDRNSRHEKERLQKQIDDHNRNNQSNGENK